MVYTKIEHEFYNGVPVNWKNDNKHSPLIKEFLDEIFDMMNSSVKDSQYKDFKPVLIRFDLKSYPKIDSDVKKFIKKASEIHKTKNKYFKIYFQQEKNTENNHYHFIVIVDGKKDYKSYKKFAIEIQKIWNGINSEIELYTRNEDHYYKIWKKLDFDQAYFAASYLAKFKDKEKRINFRERKGESSNSQCLNQIDETIGLFRLPDVLAILKIAKSTLYLGIKKGIYPKPYKLGNRTSVWKRTEIFNLVQNL